MGIPPFAPQRDGAPDHLCEGQKNQSLACDRMHRELLFPTLRQKRAKGGPPAAKRFLLDLGEQIAYSAILIMELMPVPGQPADR